MVIAFVNWRLKFITVLQILAAREIKCFKFKFYRPASILERSKDIVNQRQQVLPLLRMRYHINLLPLKEAVRWRNEQANNGIHEIAGSWTL